MAVEEASSSGGEEGSGAWTREQEKAFENAVATMAEEADGDSRWEKIAEAVEGKTAEEVRRHYELLVEDIEGIEAGRVPLPTYAVDGGAEEGASGGGGGKKGAGEEGPTGRRGRRSRPSRSAGRGSPGQKTSTDCSFLDLRSMAKVTGGASLGTL